MKASSDSAKAEITGSEPKAITKLKTAAVILFLKPMISLVKITHIPFISLLLLYIKHNKLSSQFFYIMVTFFYYF